MALKNAAGSALSSNADFANNSTELVAVIRAQRKGGADFEADSAFIACTDYLEAWKNKNYGKMSHYLSRLIVSNHGNAMPKIVREDYAAYALESFDILALNHSAAAACEVEVKIKVTDRNEQTVTLRWLYEGKEGDITMLPKGNGEWRLMSWGVTPFALEAVSPVAMSSSLPSATVSPDSALAIFEGLAPISVNTPAIRASWPLAP